MHDELVPVAIKTHWACEYKVTKSNVTYKR